MITVIILHSEHSAIYMMPQKKTVSELLAHWISDTGQTIASDSMKFLTLDGYTLTDDTNVEEIPLSDIDTRCVTAVCRDLSPEAAAAGTAQAVETACADIAATRERQRAQEKKMKASGLYVGLSPNGELESLDDDDDVEVQAVAADFSGTALQYRHCISIRLGIDLSSFRLRNDKDEVIEDKLPLRQQGITPNTKLVIEKKRSISVHIVSRKYSRSKEVSVYREHLVYETILEKNIPTGDQRVCFDGCRLSLTPSTTVIDVFGEDFFMSSVPLEVTVVLREAVVVNRDHRSSSVGVWPDDKIDCLLRFEPETDFVLPDSDKPVSQRWAYKPELIKDVLFSDKGDHEKGMIFYRGEALDKTKTLAELALPLWALVSIDPPKITFLKEYEYEISLRIPLTSTVSDIRKMLLREKPALFTENFQLCGPGRRHLTPESSSLTDWGMKDGDQIIIDPIRVPQVILIRRR